MNQSEVKVIAESIGIANLPEKAARDLVDDASYRLKVMIQDAANFMRHGKRKRLSCADFDHALNVKNVEPLYGLNDVGGGQLPKLPLDVCVKTHWLSTEGIQPTLPENPPPAWSMASNLRKWELNKTQKSKNVKRGIWNVRQLATHRLSEEQQLYYEDLTEACIGSDVSRQTEAFEKLAFDPTLSQLLPHLSGFIAEGVKVNVLQKNLPILIYLMRMTKELLANQALIIHLRNYMHELIPAVASCIVSEQVCNRPDVYNHWELRDSASNLMALINTNFDTTTNSVRMRSKCFFSKILQNEAGSLASHYGAIAALSAMGHDVVKEFVLSRIKTEGERIRLSLEGPMLSNEDKVAAQQTKRLILCILPPVLKALRQPPDNVEEYKAELGYLGPLIHAAVVKARQQPATTTTRPTNTRIINIPSGPRVKSSATRCRTPTTESIGITRLPEEAVQNLANNSSYKPDARSNHKPVMIQDAAKSIRDGKRKRLSIADIEHARKLKKVELLKSETKSPTEKLCQSEKRSNGTSKSARISGPCFAKHKRTSEKIEWKVHRCSKCNAVAIRRKSESQLEMCARTSDVCLKCDGITSGSKDQTDGLSLTKFSVTTDSHYEPSSQADAGYGMMLSNLAQKYDNPANGQHTDNGEDSGKLEFVGNEESIDSITSCTSANTEPEGVHLIKNEDVFDSTDSDTVPYVDSDCDATFAGDSQLHLDGGGLEENDQNGSNIAADNEDSIDSNVLAREHAPVSIEDDCRSECDETPLQGWLEARHDTNQSHLGPSCTNPPAHLGSSKKLEDSFKDVLEGFRATNMHPGLKVMQMMCSVQGLGDQMKNSITKCADEVLQFVISSRGGNPVSKLDSPELQFRLRENFMSFLTSTVGEEGTLALQQGNTDDMIGELHRQFFAGKSAI